MTTLRHLLPALVLATLAYLRSWNGSFVWGDAEWIERAAALASSRHLFGDDPAGYHVGNTLLHLLCTALLFRLWRRLRDDPAEAGWAAALFAVLPVLAEAVVSLPGRGELLGATLALGAFALHLHSRRRAGPAAAPWVMALAALYGLALLVGEGAVVLPGLLLAYELLHAADGLPWRRRLLRIAWLAAPFCPAMGLRAPAVAAAAAPPAPGTALLQVVPISATYLSWTLVPHTLVVGRSWTPPHLAVQVGMLVSGLLVAVCFVLWRRRTAGAAPRAFGLVWFVVALSPAVLLALRSGTMAERHLYLPAVGVAWWLGHEAGGFVRWFDHVGRGRLARVLMGVILALLLARTALRTEDWDNDILLYMSAVEDDPDNPTALYRLGTVLAGEGEVNVAGKLLGRARELAPHDVRIANNMGVLLRRRTLYHGAHRVLRQAHAFDDRDPLVHYNLALVELDLGRVGAAQHHLGRALAGDPAHEGAGRMLEALRARLRDGGGRLPRVHGELAR